MYCRYGFPPYVAREATLLRLAYDNSIGPNLVSPDQYDAGCPKSSLELKSQHIVKDEL